jgi:hypothetical protein
MPPLLGSRIHRHPAATGRQASTVARDAERRKRSCRKLVRICTHAPCCSRGSEQRQRAQHSARQRPETDVHADPVCGGSYDSRRYALDEQLPTRADDSVVPEPSHKTVQLKLDQEQVR